MTTDKIHRVAVIAHRREMIPVYCAILMMLETAFPIEHSLVKVLEILVLLKDVPMEV